MSTTTPTPDSKVWFITGAGRGIGASIAKAALAAGHRVVATGRRPDDVEAALGTSDDLRVVALDVTDERQIQAAVQLAVDTFGSIDVLVNNAGYGLMGVFEQMNLQEIRDQFETNVFGTMAVTHAVAPLMRAQRSGHVFLISSVAGRKAVFGASAYAASKFTVEGFGEALAEELAHVGVHVTTVAPGFFRTDFLDASSASYTENAIPEYAEALQEFLDFHEERNHTQAGDPDKLGEVLVRITGMDEPPTSFLAGSDAVEWAMTAIKERTEHAQRWAELSASTDGDWAKQV